MPEQTLYRYWAGEKLLYVGISVRAFDRAKQHSKTSKWWYEADRMTMETYPDRLSVTAAEKAAIQSEKPLYNIVHNRGATKPLVRGKLYNVYTEHGFNRGPTPLTLTWEVDYSSVFGDFTEGEELEAWSQFRKYAEKTEDLPISWMFWEVAEYVQRPDWTNDSPGVDKPFGPFREHGHPIPRDADTGELIRLYDLESRPTPNSEMMYKDCKWRPSPMQTSVPTKTLLMFVDLDRYYETP